MPLPPYDEVLGRKLYDAIKAVLEVAPSEPEAPSEPAPEPIPDPVPTTTYSAQIRDVNHAGNFEKGVRVGATRAVQINGGAQNEAAFSKGTPVTLADGIQREVTSLEKAGAYLNIHLSGSAIDPAVCGHPQSISTGEQPVVVAPVPQEPKEQTPAPSAPTPVDTLKNFSFLGMNIAGAEFGGTFPGTHNQTYVIPTERDLLKWQTEGIKRIRVPFKWERVQRTLYGELHAEDMARFDKLFDAAHKLGMVINLDMHNYFERYVGTTRHEIGSTLVPAAAWLDCWKRLAFHYKDHPALFAFGIMNEPRGTNGRYWPIAQQCITLINEVAPDKWITACGDGYGNAHGFTGKNKGIESITGKNLLIEVHVYFDHDHKGTYVNREEKIPADIGTKRMSDAIAVARKQGFKLYVGEVGAPHDMPTGHVALKNFLDLCVKEGIPVDYWSGGPWWSEGAANGIEVKGQLREPITLLRQYRDIVLPVVGPV